MTRHWRGAPPAKMRNPARILVVDDVADNVEILRMRLSSLGYEVMVAEDGEQALAKVREALPDLILLDIMMPKIDGLEVVRRIKADPALPFIPVILVTAKAGPKDVVAGLDAGGDDYLVKPFAFSELLARLEALLRRGAGPTTTTRLRVADLELDLLTRSVRRAGKAIEVLPREFRLLEYLMRNAGHVVTRTMLLEHVWDYHFDPQTNVIDVHISRLRQKIDKSFDHPLLQTVRGAGYCLRAPE